MNTINIFLILIILILNILGIIIFIINFSKENYSIIVENIVKNIMLGKKNYSNDPTSTEISILNKKTNIVDKYIQKYSKIYNIPWKFKIITSNINSYFTYEDYIYIPQHKVNNISINILLHEKIHILQRKYKQIFDNFYKKYLNYKSKNIELSSKWSNLYLINPDALDINWVFKENDNYYLPLLLKDFKKVVILLDKNYKTTNKTYNFNDFKFFDNYKNYKFIDLYHPNEILACSISYQILGNYNNNNINILLSKFK